MHHQNSVIDNIVIAVINDGNGSLCGSTYDERVAWVGLGEKELLINMTLAAKHYIVKSGQHVSNNIVVTAGKLLSEYYSDHVSELE